MLKKGLILCCSLYLVACGQFELMEPVPQIQVTKDGASRIVKSAQNLVSIRPAPGSSDQYSTTLPSFTNIASVISPTSSSSTGDVQATSTTLSGNYTYISYNMIGEEVFGAIDIVNIADPSNPTIEYTYTSSDFEFSDIKIQGNYLFLAGYRKESPSATAGAVLMVLDVSSKSNPVIERVVDVPGIYATSLDLVNTKILVNTGTTGGVHKYDISNPENPILISSIFRQNGLFATLGNAVDYSLSGSSNTSFEALANNPGIGPSSLIIAPTVSEAPSRFVRQNGIVYLNNTQSGKLHVIDVSQATIGSISQITSLTVPGTANGIAFDQQIVYLAQGEKGVYAVNVASPSLPVILGRFAFDDSGSANNLWIDKNANGKFFFLADGRQGLRILKENIPAPVASSTISFYARGMDYDGEAKVVIKVNGSVFQTVSLAGSSFNLYNIPYTSTLSPTDVVDLVFINDKYQGTYDTDRNAMVAYLKINDNYCYISGVEDTGLFSNLQTLSASQTSCNTTASIMMCSPGTDKIPAESCTLQDNRIGKMVCDPTGLGYLCEDTGSCQSGYVSIGGSCMPQVCQANTEKQDCSDSVSNRERTCNAQGTGFGSCEYMSCKAGHTEVNSECVPQICSPNSTDSCSSPNGSGQRLCNANGTAYGSCVTTTCNSGYYLSNGSCVAQLCSPNSSESCVFMNALGTKTCNAQGSAYGLCVTGTTCESGYHYSAGMCVPNTCQPNSISSCAIQNGIGTQTCNAQGSAHNSCQVASCNASHYQSGNSCLPQACAPNSTQSCVNNHLVGTQTCNANGSAYGSCVTGTTCEAGYFYNNGVCSPQVCSPNSSATCSGSNGTGTKVCNAQGSGYGSCQINACNAGFYLQNGSCVAQTCSPNSTQSCVSNHLIGTQTCNTQGSSYGSCQTGTTCEAGYYYSNGQCLAQSCSPNSSTSCSENNGLGVKTCNAHGSSYGSCQITSCNAGFTLQNGSCVAQICTPNASVSCSLPNGTGVKVCNSQGLDFGSCSLTVCNAGFYNNGGTCVEQSCVPAATQSCVSNHLVGVQTCNAQGSSYGSCVTGTGCESGYYYSNGQCLAQACSPLSTTSCATANGSGTKTCNALGSAYGSCQTVSCNSGFYNNNGSCVAQVCSPNTSQSCVSNHYLGTQMCNTQGSGFGTCVTGVTCESGYYNSGLACVPQVCSPNTTASCSANNGTGTYTCNANGSAYGSCTINQCNSGYALVNGSCVAQVCSPNATASCSENNGSGTKKCNANGTAYGPCQITSCNPGFCNNNGVCTAQVCSPNTTASCSVSNGVGSRTCNAQGSAYGSCQAISCNSGYDLVNGSCVFNANACSVANGSGTLTSYSGNGLTVTHGLTNDWTSGYSYQIRVSNNSSTAIQDWSVCFDYNYNVGNAGFYNAVLDSSSEKPNWRVVPFNYNKMIYPGSNVTVNWNATPGNVGSNRLQNVRLYNSSNATCSDTPVYSSSPICVASSCNSGYHLEGTTCASNTRTCSVPNGTGTQTWNGTEYGPCGNVTCSNSSLSVINVNLAGRTQECQSSCPIGLVRVKVGGINICL